MQLLVTSTVGQEGYSSKADYCWNYGLKIIAASGNSTAKFAFGNDTVLNAEGLIALVQCTPDLDEGECNGCLDHSILQIPDCCGGKDGGQVLTPNCNLSTFKQNLNTLLFSQLTSNTKIGYRMETIKWEELCMVRYSNKPIFSVMKDKPIVKAPSQNIPLDPNNFMLVLKPMLYSLTSKASSGDSLRKFSTENETVPRYETIYALTQCTSDISKQECTDCLKRATLILSECYDGVQGARILKSNCSLRYEVYPFYNYIADDSPATSPPSKGIYGSL
ncbi:hypothetical protein FEM48_ZijujUnG0014800 [Ziziphus jujuba var. spinosa]|uniref:Gnk2-homologous domain-containing protein n=1 Tax=Ziziphus jujuba var. spinosa TaxID=714518 RepID=A0A978U9W8_ZIZJJ|nr:hypothetical protein FEM48_ZijujUnG0014800 [Ziziphus jujuba var. spinosa]